MDTWQRDRQQDQRNKTPAAAIYSSKKTRVPVRPTKQQQQQKNGKRQGPLPLWLAQFVVVGAFGAVAFAFVQFSDGVKGVFDAVDKTLLGLGGSGNGPAEKNED